MSNDLTIKEETLVEVYEPNKAGRPRGMPNINTLDAQYQVPVILKKYNRLNTYQREYVQNLSQEKKEERKRKIKENQIKKLQEINTQAQNESAEEFQERLAKIQLIKKIKQQINKKSCVYKSTGCKQTQEEILRLKMRKNEIEGNYTLIEQVINTNNKNIFKIGK